jgi:valyl-tRNA synthetase
MLHPVIPFVTEELWTALTGEQTVVIAPWPVPDLTLLDPDAVAEIEAVMRLTTEIRRFRAEQGLAPGQRVPARLLPASAVPGRGASAVPGRGTSDAPEAADGGTPGSPAGLLTTAHRHEAALRALARLAPPSAGFTPTASLAVDGGTVELDLSGAIDVAAERRRLDKDLTAARREAEQATRKLDNPQFLAKAPAAEVAKVRARLADAQASIDRLSAQIARLPTRT